MNGVDFSEPIKTCLWLNSVLFEIPLNLLTSPALVISYIDNVKFDRDFVEDPFEVYIAKCSESIIEVVVFRNRINPNGKPDDGCALKFFFNINCFDDETQSAIMKYDDEKVCASFRLTENVLKRAKSTHDHFELFVVVQMLEFKSLDKKDPSKVEADGFIAFIKRRLSPEELKHLGSIMQNPNLEDVFTGNYI